MKKQLKYKIVESISSNSINRIFTAFDSNNGEMVVLKEITKERILSEDFLDKINLVLSLDHPNIAAYRHLEYQGNSSYLVMDYGEGGNLRHAIVDAKNCSLDRSLQLIIDILSGLAYAHNRGIVHCNLKPENILLKLNNRGWKAQIADFELLKFDRVIDYKNFDEGLDNPYQAPEQFGGKSSYSSDLYGVGVLLFELLTGKPPLANKSMESNLAQRNCTLVIPDCIPLILHSAIAKALQPQPDRRFPNAGKMLESIQLAKEILSATQPDIALQLSADDDRDFTPLQVVSQEKLLQPVTNLAINSQQVYLETKNRLIGKLSVDSSLTGTAINQWQIFLDNNIETLQIRPQGCFVSTQSASVYYSPQHITSRQFQFFSKTSLPILSLPTNQKLLMTIDPQGYWMSLAYILSKTQDIVWEIIKLPHLKVIHSQTLTSLPSRLIALNRRYGLAIFSEKYHHQATTTLRLFNRRGNWLGNYRLAIALRLVSYNPLFSDRILAIEDSDRNSTMGILINLKPFQVTRIPLPFTPTWIIPQTQGYLLSDRQGKIAIVNCENNSISQFKLPLTPRERITAIATDDRSQILTAVWSNVGGRLVQLSMDNVVG